MTLLAKHTAWRAQKEVGKECTNAAHKKPEDKALVICFPSKKLFFKSSISLFSDIYVASCCPLKSCVMFDNASGNFKGASIARGKVGMAGSMYIKVDILMLTIFLLHSLYLFT